MRTRIGRTAAVLAAAVVAAVPTVGSAHTAPAADPRVDQLERRLTELERQYRQDLEARDQEIDALRQQLQSNQPTPTTPASPAPAGAATDDVERTRQDVLRDLDARDADLPLPLRTPADFNPDMAVIVDTVGTYSPDRENDAYNRFDVREAELDLRAAVDPRADGVLVLAFERDVENPIFAEQGGEEEEEGGGPETSAGVEEAYIFLHDFGVPNLTAKLGRFHLRFGRQNILHLHDLPTTDPAFVSQAFLAPEALIDSGISLSYVVPSDLVGGQYVELIGEVIAGEGAGSESPVFGGDLSVDSPGFNGHVLWNTDLAQNVNFELGGSWLTGERDADNGLDANLFGVDATLLLTDSTGGFRNWLFQSEAIYGVVDNEGGTEESFGAYVLGQRQLNRDVYAGLRLDWTQNPDDADQEAWGVTPYVSWYWSEFLRFRASYQHRDGDRNAEDIVYLQATWIFGAHPPHPYWSMR